MMVETRMRAVSGDGDCADKGDGKCCGEGGCCDEGSDEDGSVVTRAS